MIASGAVYGAVIPSDGVCMVGSELLQRPNLTDSVIFGRMGLHPALGCTTETAGFRRSGLDLVVTTGFILPTMNAIMEIETGVDDASLAGQVWENPRLARGLGWVSLFASAGTWICCALPILLVTVGAGAILAGITSQFPLLTALGAHKNWMFAISAVLLLAAAGLTWRSGQRCPADPVLARQCQRVRRWNKRVLWVSVIVWFIGFMAAYLALPVRIYFDQ